MNKDTIFAIKQALSSVDSLPTRIVCPSCGGGSTREACMLVSRNDHGIFCNCFRANCEGGRGYLDGGGFIPPPAKKAVREIQPVPTTTSLPAHVFRELPHSTYSVAPRWREDWSMVMYPVLSYWGAQLGYVQRHYKSLNSWWKGAKAKNIVNDNSQPFLHFPLLTNEKMCGTLYVVEDVPSAEAIAPYAASCALLGTNITDEALSLFRDIGVTHLKICLDNDAIGKSIQLKRNLSLLFNEVSVVWVDKDPKDMSEADLINLFGGT